MRTSPHQTGSGHVLIPDPCLGPARACPVLGPWDLPCGWPRPIRGVRIPFQGFGLHKWMSGTNLRGSDYISEGPGPTLGVRTVYPGVRRSPGGSGLTVDALEYATSSGHVATLDPPMWWSRALLWTQNSRLR
jgi:hypothetical protein